MQFDQNNQIEIIDEKEVAGYQLFRSPTQHRKVNVVAINKDGDALFVRESDMEIDDAIKLLEELNN